MLSHTLLPTPSPKGLGGEGHMWVSDTGIRARFGVWARVTVGITGLCPRISDSVPLTALLQPPTPSPPVGEPARCWDEPQYLR